MVSSRNDGRPEPFREFGGLKFRDRVDDPDIAQPFERAVIFLAYAGRTRSGHHPGMQTRIWEACAERGGENDSALWRRTVGLSNAAVIPWAPVA